jgi:hypothetical protein
MRPKHKKLNASPALVIFSLDDVYGRTKPDQHGGRHRHLSAVLLGFLAATHF